MQDKPRDVVENARKVHTGEENSVFNVLRCRLVTTRLKRKCTTTQINANKRYDIKIAKKIRQIGGLSYVHSVT